jgi:hypothetical protein
MKNIIKLGLVSAVSLGLVHSIQADTKGWLKREHFAGKSRAQVEGGTAGAPTYTAFLHSFQTTDFSDNYAQRISGFFTPATTGNYNFFVASDDDSDLFLSTDADPANKQKIASEPTWNGARSWTATTRRATPPENRSDSTFAPTGIHLVGGTKYYIEGVHHEGGGGDNFGATFAPVGTDPTDGDESLLTGDVISIADAPTVGVAIQPVGKKVLLGDVAGFSTLGTTPNAQYQWFKGTTAITDATNATYSTAATTVADNNTKYHVVITDSEVAGSATSDEVTLFVSSPVFSPGFLRDELFRGHTRTEVEDGTVTVPDDVKYVSALDIADRGEDNFANRTSGYFTPAVTGDYVIFVSSDDDSDFFISTNDDPATKVLVASEPGWNGSRAWVSTTRRGTPPENRSDSTAGFENGIHLVKDTRYYIEMVHHEGGGGDNNGATFSLFADAGNVKDGDLSKFTGPVIGTFAPSYGFLDITNQPQSVTKTTGETATFSVGISTDAGALSYQWQRNGSDIPGATGASYTTGLLGPGDNNATFKVNVLALGGPATNSATATLTVSGDPDAPKVASAGALKSGTSVGVQFDKPVGASGGTASHYTLAGNTVTAAAVQADASRVILTVQNPITASGTLTVTGVANLDGVAGDNGSASLGIIPLVSEDIGDSSVPDPAVPGSAAAFSDKDLVVNAGGSDIWNSADGFRFSYEKATNDFDIEVQVVSMVAINNWTAGALMVRETLAPGSRDWHLKVTPRNQTAKDGSGTGANGYESNRRNAVDSATAGWTGQEGDHTNPNYPNAWIRLQRTNTTMVCYRSDDGVNWTTMAVEDTSNTDNVPDGPLTPEVFIGVATTSHNNTADPGFLTTVVYKNYRHHSNTVPAPTLTVAKLLNGKLHFTWTDAAFHLESRGAVNTGAWTDVPGGGTSGVDVDANGAAQFFRLSNVP